MTTGSEGGGPSGESADAVTEIRRLLLLTRFDDAVRLSGSAARVALGAGDPRAFRRITCQGAAALFHLGRFDEALRRCHDVIDSPGALDDPKAVGHACNLAAISAHRLGLPDTLRWLDEALLIGEQLFSERGRLDSLCRAAASAGTIGLAELGDAVFTEYMLKVDAGEAGDVSPGGMMYLKSQQILVRCWWALALEHEGDPRAADLFSSAAVLAAAPALRDRTVLPAKTIAAYDAYEAFAHAFAGRPDRARAPLAAAWTVSLGGTFDMVTGALELLRGLAHLRSQPHAHDPRPRPFVRHLRGVARRCGDARLEAELWRLTAELAAADGDSCEAAYARERFESMVDGLDWRQRLQGAQVLQLRSLALRGAAMAAGHP